jgi:glycosyltransferase involved in cell wall biosynthesis
VVWVSFHPLEKTQRGLTSKWASVRYRLLIPAAVLEAQQWDSRVSYFGAQTNQRTVAARFSNTDIVILGKFVPPAGQIATSSQHLVKLLEALRGNGVRIISDFCDDHFLHAELGPAYVSLLNAADAATASTPGLAAVLLEHGASIVHTITDPVEGERKNIVVRNREAGPATPASPLRLLWYGHQANLATLSFGLPQIERLLNHYPVSLTIVASGERTRLLAQEVDAVWKARGSACRFVPWTTEVVFAELARCDAVLIPSNPHDPLKAIKSPNRFSEAVWAGRFVVAHPLPAYEELAAFGWVGEDLAQGLEWYVERSDEAAARVHAGQSMIEKRFSRAAVADAWKNAISSTMDRK